MIKDIQKVTHDRCPNLSEIITRMMSGAATGVMVKVPGKINKTYNWQRSLEREKTMTLIGIPPSGSVWDTIMSKSPPEVTQSGTIQNSAKSSNVKENSGQTKRYSKFEDLNIVSNEEG